MPIKETLLAQKNAKLEKEVAAKNRQLEIEAALEKVRARSLAMHQSDELKDVVQSVFEQLCELNIKFYTAIIFIFNEDTRDIFWWLVNQMHQQHSRVFIPYADVPYLHGLFEAKERGDHFFAAQYTGAEKRTFYSYLLEQTDLKKYVSEEQRIFLLESEFSTMSVALSKNTAIHITRYTSEIFSESDNEVLKKFSKVFEQAYTRFLDLQKAEAQARESQIQLALERVRARTMAMQKSEELAEVASVVFRQLMELNIQHLGSGFVIFDNDKPAGNMWMSFQGDVYPQPMQVNFEISDVLLPVYEAWKEGKAFYINPTSGEKYRQHMQLLVKIFGERVSDVLEKIRQKYLEEGKEIPDRAVMHHTYFKYGSLILNNTAPIKEQDILDRFAKVFEQSYTRFLDLQKAEAQAREAQIQLALERVRARTMAMQKSDELSEAANLLFKQVQALGMPTWSAGYCIWDDNMKAITLSMSRPFGDIQPSFRAPLDEDTSFINFLEAHNRGEDLFIEELSGKALEQNYQYLGTLPVVGEQLEAIIKEGHPLPTYQVNHCAYFSKGFLLFITHEQVPGSHEIFKRFANVFDQTYTRFLDLQQAEDQAKEVKIQLALERVRARTMAMHNSEDVSEAVATMFKELKRLNIQNFRGGILSIRSNQTMDVWSANTLEDGKIIRAIGGFDMTIHPFWQQLYAGWKSKTDLAYFDMSGEVREDYERILNARRDYLPNGIQLPDCHVQSYFFNGGAIWTFSLHPHTDDQQQIMKRFAAVFSLTFRRYQDLKQAEAQVREATIEAALERVRAKTMAMHKSEQLPETAEVFFEQFNLLGNIPDRMSIGIINEQTNNVELWVTDQSGKQVNTEYFFSLDEPTSIAKIYTAWKNSKEAITVDLTGNDLEAWLRFVKQKAMLPIDESKIKGRRVQQAALFSRGFLLLTTHEPVAEETMQLLVRFARVFSITYTRFLDLQKAEAQVRESEIQLALERVRARTMAMQHSTELGETSFLLVKQVKALGIDVWGCAFNIFNEEEKNSTEWFSNQEGYQPTYKLPREGVFLRYYEAAQRGESLHIEEFAGEKCAAHYRYLRTLPILGDVLHHYSETGISIPTFQIDHVTFFKHGYLLFITQKPVPGSHDIFKRFAAVFEQTYTRFLDLQKAEAQARESKIEAALERVRSRAMAMRGSEELSVLVAILFDELTKLDLVLARCIIWIFDIHSLGARLWMANSEEKSTVKSYWIKRIDHPYYNAIIKAWQERKQKWMYDLQGSEKQSIDAILLQETELSRLPEPVKKGIAAATRIIVAGSFNNFGLIEASGPQPYSDEQLEILLRFGKAFDLGYTRFNDLQQAEILAKEAVKQAALDRIRAEIASMRTVDDLDRITPLIWNELSILQVPFIRCGVFIMDDTRQLIHSFLSTPTGNAIAAFHLPYSIPGNMGHVLQHWREKKDYIDSWDKSAFMQFADILKQQGGEEKANSYLKSIPHSGIHLHFLYFLQGMLYVGNTKRLTQEEIGLLQSVAGAFSTAYARYEDFKKLEAAKKQVDSTLSELQATQKQLIQSEKMASLGELTAGIAHEIQNPLNFVNNFSEVNVELIEELRSEKSKVKSERDEALEQELLNDIAENERKINHHGKRADAIVKGMLQHSRSSSGVKEPTDINALCDEYLRLSYHGLRAKDKSFNATLNTDFDASIGKLNIIPQDIGRVVLNLINNAFYAVAEKKKQAGADYSPTVTVGTRLLPPSGESRGALEIKVADNGNGIPQSIVDKIFQPFFTTKPTGQGTGLGLSLAYDIIKAHGGELKVSTSELQGTTFTINLPVT